MSDDEYVYSIYEKYKNEIILVQFDWYFDSIHMVHRAKQVYRSLAASSKFFTIIDSDEYLYLYDQCRVIKDNSIVKFIENNIDCNFFVPYWIENIADNENLLSFNPQNMEPFHLSKPIINTNTIPMFELALTKYPCPILHHTHDLPILTYGKTKTNFLLVHLKNLNKYQRITTNMNKLAAVNIVKHNKDFLTLFKLDSDTIQGNWRTYVLETRKLTEMILQTHEQSAKLSKNGIIELCADGVLTFSPESYEQDFKKLLNSDYFDLIHFDINKIDIHKFTTIKSCRQAV
jgi:hypothetical protein